MGQQLSAAGVDGQSGERGSHGGMETAIPVSAWRVSQLQANSRDQSDNGESSGDSGARTATASASGKNRSSSREAADGPGRFASSRNYPGVGAGGSEMNGDSCGGIGAGGGVEAACGRGSSTSESDIGRMSVRAAIDSFIENCLSARNEPGPRVNLSSITGLPSNCASNNDSNSNSDSNHDTKLARNDNSNSNNCNDRASPGNDSNGVGDKEKSSSENKKVFGGSGEEKRDSVEYAADDVNNTLDTGDAGKEPKVLESGASGSDDAGDQLPGKEEETSSSDNVKDVKSDGDSSSRSPSGTSGATGGEIDGGVLVIDCDNEGDTPTATKVEGDTTSKSTTTTNLSSNSVSKDMKQGAEKRPPPRPTDSPHVIDVDSEEFASFPPSSGLFPSGKNCLSGSKSGSPVNLNNNNKRKTKSSSDERLLEKKTFSDYLQDKLIQQIESNELRGKSSNNVLAWEVSTASSTPTNASTLNSRKNASSTLSSGPVRLQTLIDKVLDQSLNKELGPRPKPQSSSASGNQVGPISSASVTGYISKPEGPTRVKISTMCFKDHIEKVLEENFRSYEEEEEENNREDASHNSTNKTSEEKSDDRKSPDVEIIKESPETESANKLNKKNFESGRLVPDRTISVQDIVDRVISQTEVINKLPTPSLEQKSGASSSQDEGGASSSRNTSLSGGAGGSSNNSMGGGSGQKSQRPPGKSEHTSQGGSNPSRPAPTGRKRGRPRLGSPVHKTSKNSDRSSDRVENRNPPRPGYPHGPPPPQQQPSPARARMGQSGPPPLDYVSPHRLPMPPLVGPQGSIQPISYHQGHPNHHPSSHPPPQQHSGQNQQHGGYYNSSVPPPPPHSSSAPRSSPGSYPPPPSHALPHRNFNSQPPQVSNGGGGGSPPPQHPGHHPHRPHQQQHHHHQQQQQQHRPVSPLVHRRHPDHISATSSRNPHGDSNNPSISKPLPLLVLPDHVNGSPATSGGSSLSTSHHNSSPRYHPVSHTPTPSCPCDVCVATFSTNRSPHQQQQPHPHHHHPPPPSQQQQQQPPHISGSGSLTAYPPPPINHQLPTKQYIPRRGDDQHHNPQPSHHPHQYQPYHHQNNSPASSQPRRDPNKESLKPVVPTGGKQLPPQAIIPSFVVTQRPVPDPSQNSISYAGEHQHSQAEDGNNRQRLSSFSDSRPPQPHPQPHHPSYPPPSHRNPNLPDDVTNYRASALPPHSYPGESDRPMDLHKPHPRNTQHTPPASSSPLAEDEDRPLDLSVKPSSAYSDSQPTHKRPDPTPYTDRMPHNDSVDPRDHHGGQSYPIQNLEDSVKRHLPTAAHTAYHQPQQQHQQEQQQQQQQQPPPPYQQQYYQHPGSSSSSSSKLPSPILLQHGSGRSSNVSQQPNSNIMNPDGKHYQHSPSAHSSYPYPKRVESPSSQRGGNPHGPYPPYHSPISQNPPNSSSSTASLLSLPPHLRRSHSSGGGSDGPSSNQNRSIYQRASPYSDSNQPPPAVNHPKPEDMPMPRLYQPLPPPSSSAGPQKLPMENNTVMDGAPPSHSTPPDLHQQPPPHHRPPPPLIKPQNQPQQQPLPPPQQQQLQQQQQSGNPPNSGSSNDDQDSLKHISRHEPIQNILGNHPQNDILYLICKLCRQTYGSPYGFRKHFRNQHGFEPKVEHTIVQTISATKTAMGHNNIIPDGVGFDETKIPLDENNMPLDAQIKQEVLDYNSEDLNPSQIAAYNRAQEHVKIIFKQNGGEDGGVENSKLLECPECRQTFQLNDFGSYKRHCRQHSMVQSSGPFSCHDCHRSFAEPGQLEQHLNTHNTFTPSVCGICRTFFSSPHYLAEHLQAAHGHVLPSELSKKSPQETSSSDPFSMKPEKASPDMPQVYHSLDLQGRIERAFMLDQERENAGNETPSNTPGQKRSSPPVLSLSTASLSTLPPTKRHRVSSTASSGHSSPTAAMLTVHTPKQLEVQKRPADPTVHTATADSSFDDLSYSNKPTSTSSKSSGEQDKDSAVNLSGDGAKKGNYSPLSLVKSSKNSTGDGSSNVDRSSTPSGRASGDSLKSTSGDGNRYASKDKEDNESVSSERCASVESNSNSNNSASLASSPGLADESQMFYKHKKYSRYLKRRASNDNNNNNNNNNNGVTGSTEPCSESKTPKLNASGGSETDTTRTTSSSSSSSSPPSSSTPSTSTVTSSATSSVRIEDCQSSSNATSVSGAKTTKKTANGATGNKRTSPTGDKHRDKKDSDEKKEMVTKG